MVKVIYKAKFYDNSGPVKFPVPPGSLPAVIDFSRSDLPVCQVFLPLLLAASVKTISNSKTISSAFQSVFF